MNIINYNYKGSEISFERGKDVMVNLTSMAKPFPEKNLTQIINSLEIKEYCNSLTKLQNYSLTENQILKTVRGGSNPGTWGHRLLASRVAQKLNSDFAVWVDIKIDELLHTGVATVSNDDEAIAYAMQVLSKRLEQARIDKELLEQQNTLLTNEIKDARPKIQYVDNVLNSSKTYTSTQIAKEVGFTSAEKFHHTLKERKIMFNQSGQWMLTAKYSDKGYTKPRTAPYFNHKTEKNETNTITVWTEKGRQFIHTLLTNQSIN